MLTTQLEGIAQAMAEAAPLMEEHYQELSGHRAHGFPVAPLVGQYLAREARGELLCVTLRDAGKLVGYYVGVVAPGMHYGTCLTLATDLFWVAKSHRGHFGGPKLFKAVLAEAKRRGVKVMFAAHKLAVPEAGRLFTILGFQPVETNYALWLEDA